MRILYLVRIELVLKNHIIVSIKNRKNNLTVYALIEDVYREAELFKDFSHLYPKIYKTNEEFQNDNSHYNLIRVNLFPQFNITKVAQSSSGNEILQDFTYMAESLVEDRPERDHAVIWHEELIGFKEYEFENYADWITFLYNHILSFAEQPPSQFTYNPGHL